MRCQMESIDISSQSVILIGDCNDIVADLYLRLDEVPTKMSSFMGSY